MSTQFIDHYVHPLTVSRPTTPGEEKREYSVAVATRETPRKRALREILGALDSKPRSLEALKEQLEALTRLEGDGETTIVVATDDEDQAIRKAVVHRLVVELYAETMEAHLAQASQAEEDSEWWADVARSKSGVSLYLLQTLPARLSRVLSTILDALRAENLPATLTSVRTLLAREARALHPASLLAAAFPHLHHQARPLSLTLAHECRFKRGELARLRDERAETLGHLASLRAELRDAPSEQELAALVQRMGDPSQAQARIGSSALLPELTALCTGVLPAQAAAHRARVQELGLLRLGYWTRMWPVFAVAHPPLAAGGYAWRSRDALVEMLRDARETARGFLIGYLIEPIKDVVRTVRTGGEGGGMLVHKEAVEADIESLERMTLALARDKLSYTQAQLDNLSAQVRVGDLTPVMEMYEEDIRRPLRSVLAGSLLRNVFVQVDIDQALSGIDRLLKSQELTFAFVGVAPALLVVYLLGGATSRLYSSARRGGRYYRAGGSRSERVQAWFVMRRIERLLVAHELSARTSGLLLLSLTHLRGYGERCLLRGSRVREGFLEDVDDLEDPELGRAEKLRVVERMWRCWGDALGWGRRDSVGEAI
ncbi:ATP synthase regulation protein NCA2-domain-containing protein [Schizophyllum amplum]|uniref:ATP synthase regulation protein NCA2-domain-containing protein n=1 Tax=Schizophyllum amplum TaxID=97359 RepID=A0A550C6X1_9AGAR|nr:ATP synthase regulation protein NCA2-domain-containing protein [Auriculariopsis ampla]